MDQGRRLENLSWRLWTRETFCVDRKDDMAARSPPPDIPELSSSVESAASDSERIERHIRPRPAPAVRPAVVEDEQQSVSSVGRKDRHITSSGLEKMVHDIKEKKTLDPWASSESTSSSQSFHSAAVAAKEARLANEAKQAATQQQACSFTSAAPAERPDDGHEDTNYGLESSLSSGQASSVVRGFQPGQISSYRSVQKFPTAVSEPRPIAPLPTRAPKKKGPMFQLGTSTDESSFEERALMSRQRSQADSTGSLSKLKKVASFKEVLENYKANHPSATDDEDAIETESDDVSESAIDDDSSDWEDSISESGRSSVDDRDMFKRVDSRANLVSRPSLLTVMMHQPERLRPGAPGSRSTPALRAQRLPVDGDDVTQKEAADSDAVETEEEDDDEAGPALMMRAPDSSRSKPMPVILRHNNSSLGLMPPGAAAAAQSPRTTRRKMLANELTESLRGHLLTERKQKTTPLMTASARRPRASHDVGSGSGDKDVAASFGNYFDCGPWEYHAKGW